MSRSTRQLDRQQRRYAANKRIGYEHAYAIVAAPYVGFLASAAAAGLGAAWLWRNVDHGMVASVLAGVGGLCLILGLGIVLWYRDPRRRYSMLAGERRMDRVGAGVTAAGPLFLLAATLLWRS
jgi:hypothetical protein